MVNLTLISTESVKDQILSQITGLNKSQYESVMRVIRKGVKRDEALAIEAAIELVCFNQL